jgi:feruloyl esterase
MPTTVHPLRPSLLAMAAAALLAGCAQPGAGPAATTAPISLGTDPAAACAGLKAPVPASAIGLPSGEAQIDSATLVAASPLAVADRGPTPAARVTPALPAFCKLLGRIKPVDPRAPDILFQVNLPLQWNGRTLQYGGGGFNGTLINALGLPPAQRFDTPAPLAQGYVTVGTDSGHQTGPQDVPQAFALNDEALTNFAHASYKKVRDVSVALVQRAYARAPAKLYFMGSSEGGREGLTMAQRYPADFDGIFSRVPVIHWTGLQFAGTRKGWAAAGEGWLGTAQVQRVHEAVLAACDADDGLADDIVSDPVACKAKFKVESLRCAPGAAADSGCLNDAQIKAVQTLHSPYRFPFPLANGLTEYPGWGVSGEAHAPFGPTGGWQAWWVGRAAPVLPPKPDNGIAWFYGSGALQYFYQRNGQADPRGLDPQTVAARVRQVSALMDSTNPDLSAFQARGGKLMLLENLADYAQSPYAGIGYHQSVVRAMGADKVAGFFKLYAAPGVDHVGGGAPANVDMLVALSAWVEQGREPAGLTLVEQAIAAPAFTVLRSRPLCEWPNVPRFQGGDAKDAASFRCSR